MKYMGVGIIVNLVWVTFIDNESINLIVFVIITSSGRPFYSIIDRGGGGGGEISILGGDHLTMM